MLRADVLAEPDLTVVQAQEQKFFASFFKKEGLPCFQNVSLNTG